jgi:hypothetical protein
VEGSGDRNVYPLGSIAEVKSTGDSCVEEGSGDGYLSQYGPVGTKERGRPITGNSER